MIIITDIHTEILWNESYKGQYSVFQGFHTKRASMALNRARPLFPTERASALSQEGILAHTMFLFHQVV